MTPISLRKDIPSTSILQNWYSILMPGEQEFVTSKLKALQSLEKMQLDWAVLQNLLARWDPKTFTFRFGTLELAPTYEEYLHLSELPHRPGILSLPRTGAPRDHLPSVLGINGALVHHLITPQGHIPINELLTLQRSTYVPHQAAGQTSARAYILMVVGVILHPFTASSINGRAVYLAKAILEDKPFVPNLLGETNFGITQILIKTRAGVLHHRVTFCLQLLQAWFFTHLGVTGYALRLDRYSGLLAYIVERAYLPTRNFTGTQQFFDGLTEESFYPMARCYRTSPVFITSREGPYIPIMGISGSSYYVPLRVAHQFGGIPELPPHPPTLRAPIELDTEGGRKTKIGRAMVPIIQAWAMPHTKTFEAPEIDEELIDATTRRFIKERNLAARNPDRQRDLAHQDPTKKRNTRWDR